MHSLRLPGVPPIPPSFKRHRFDSDPSRFSLNLSLSKPIATPFWAALPSPPMSGSPPPEQPFDPPQTAGRRRKRSDTPATHAPSPISTPAVTTATTAPESYAERQADIGATTGISIQPSLWSAPYPVTQPYGYGAGTSVLPGPAPSTFQPPYLADPSSPKSTRKSKVHVPSACVNCKKKHLRCDNSRPCHRCIQSGKEVSRALRLLYAR
jgi:Fungal Zn(2)-Cys(6) binuclear cluster domain